MFLYDKGEYEAVREYLQFDWNKIMESAKEDPDKMWQIFVKKLKEAEDKYIPVLKIRPNKPNKKSHNLALDKNTREAIHKKQRKWQRYMETKDEEKLKEYRRQRNKVRAMTRKLQIEKEKKIAKQSKSNPKKFWKFVKSKLKIKTGVANLVMDQTGNSDKLTKTDGEKAEVLSSFFASVFTREDVNNIPFLEKQNVK